jgi:predicted ATP-binding protein involved in virulence
LHQKWQRRVIKDLKRTFPKIQFIATTHSPQLIGEAEPWEVIRLGGTTAQGAAQSFGMDSNWILTHVMSADKRDEGVERDFEKVEQLISSLKLDEAKAVVNKIREEIRGNHPELVRLSARIDRLAGKAK